MFPSDAGGTVFLNYDYQDQNHNWSGTSSAPNANNDDKKIETHFVTLGAQYMFNRSWGAQVELPFANRTFDSAGNAAALNWTGLGDIRLKGIYTGFSEDLSSGLTFGMKLPTGSFSHTMSLGGIDRDTQIGSGSTDILLGGFHRDRFGASHWNWFAQAELDLPALTQGDYRPGFEADAAAGIYYDGLSLGRVKISPVAQIIVQIADNTVATTPHARLKTPRCGAAYEETCGCPAMLKYSAYSERRGASTFYLIAFSIRTSQKSDRKRAAMTE